MVLEYGSSLRLVEFAKIFLAKGKRGGQRGLGMGMGVVGGRGHEWARREQ